MMHGQQNIKKNSLRASQSTDYISITNIGRWKQFRERVAFYWTKCI